MFGRRSKYGNQRTVVDGISFASKKEARHYVLLKGRADRGEIEMLRRQVRFALVVNGFHVCDYVADFAYMENDEYVVVDVKGVRTDVYAIKKRLMWACHKIAIKEV